MASVSFQNVEKAFGATKVIHGISFDIRDGEFMVLVGPSGCGKSTLLRMLAGLEEISAGTIAIDGRAVNDVDSKDRDIAMVFQSYALYPHMTVEQNLAFGLKLRKLPKKEIKERVERAASGSASPWGARSSAIRRCSCSTSRCRTSTRSCGSTCAPSSSGCTTGCGRPPST